MAVSTTTIAGTDSLSGSRITINDNFKTLEDALNSVLSAFDIVSGRFDNSSYGSANDILTNGIVISGTGLTNALTLNNGNINVLLGDVKVSQNYSFYIGSLLQLNKYDLGFAASSSSYPTWDLRSPGAISDEVGGIVMPTLTGPGYAAIGVTGSTVPALGTIVFTDDSPGASAPLRVWWDNGSGSGPTWWKIQMTL
jgi:hypothetical protein